VSPAARYTRTAIILHWLLVLLILSQVTLGWFLEGLQRGTPERAIYINLHKSTGICIGLVILFHISWRLTHTSPPLPQSVPNLERLAAKWSHVLLYICMVVMPLSGYIASNFSKHGVNFFNALKLPPWGVDDKPIYGFFNATHLLTSYLFVALICLHVLAALRHAWRQDGVFSRMWPAQRTAAP